MKASDDLFLTVTSPRAFSRFFVASLHELPVNPSTVSSTLPS